MFHIFFVTLRKFTKTQETQSTKDYEIKNSRMV